MSSALYTYIPDPLTAPIHEGEDRRAGFDYVVLDGTAQPIAHCESEEKARQVTAALNFLAGYMAGRRKMENSSGT